MLLWYSVEFDVAVSLESNNIYYTEVLRHCNVCHSDNVLVVSTMFVETILSNYNLYYSDDNHLG